MARLLRSLTYRLTGLLIHWLLRPVLGQRAYQSLFDQLHQVSLRGLNYGAWDFRTSGELPVLAYVSDQLARRGVLAPILIDAGANVGAYAGELLAALPKLQQLHLFEPSASCQPTLQAKFAARPEVQIHALGLSDKVGLGLLHYDQAQSGLASVHPRGGAHLSFRLAQTETIGFTTLDQFCADHQLAHIHFLKLDVEGHELAVLKGAQDLLSRGSIDFIQFEFGGANLDARTQWQDFFYLLQPNFSLFRVVNDGLWPIEQYRETDEIFTTVNFLAQRRT